jgi:hypothetical protein
VRAWLLENAQKIENGLKDYAAELGAGLDINWPAKHVVSSRNGLKIEIFYSAMPRVGGREIQTELLEACQELADDFRRTSKL